MRLLLIGGLMWAGWSAATVWTELLTVSRPGPARADRQAAVEPTGPAERIAEQLAGGSWVFGESGLPITMARVGASELDARLERPPEELHAIESPSGEARALVRWIGEFAGGGRTEGPYSVYSVRRRGLRVTAYTTSGVDGERLVLARAAIRGDAGAGWILLETSGAAASQIGARPKGGTLLPRPQRSQRLAARFDREGRLVCDVVSAPGDARSVSALWRRAGWELSRPLEAQSGMPLTCSRNGEIVEVWTHSAGDGAGLLLVEVRDPRSLGVIAR